MAKLFAAITASVVGDQASYERFKMGKDSAGLGLEKLIGDE
jgi:hypothetical protein